MELPFPIYNETLHNIILLLYVVSYMYSIVMYVHIAIVEIHSYVYIDQSKRKVHYNNNIIHSSLTESLPIAIYTYIAIKI